MIEINTNNYNGLENILKSLQLEERFQSFPTVLVKPNLVHLRSPETGTITHPDSLREVLRYLQSFYGGKVIVGESPSYFEQDIEAVFKLGGLDEIQYEFPEIEVINLREYPHEPVDFHGQYLHEVSLPTGISNWGILNLAKMKEHWITGMTAAVKNLVGLLQDPRIIHDYPVHRENIEIHERIADLYLSICKNIVLNIVDGVVGMKDGQVNGTTIYPGKIIIGEDAVQVDKRVRDYFGLSNGTPKYLEIIEKIQNHEAS